MSVSEKIVADFVANGIEFVTTVPCKQLGGVIDAVEKEPSIYHIPSNKEDEGMGLCAGAFMGGETSSHHHAKYGHWCHSEHIGDTDPVLPHAPANAHLLSG